MSFLIQFRQEEDGADMVEYALVVALIALAAVAALTNFGFEVSAGLGRLKTKVNTNVK